MLSLYNKKNGQNLEFLYPVHGKSNILRAVKGQKVASFTGPGGRGVKVEEKNGQTHSFLEKKVVIR